MVRIGTWKNILIFNLIFVAAIGAHAQTYTTLVDFDVHNGAEPGNWMFLQQGLDGNFYGTTFVGGRVNSNCTIGCGTVFQMTPSGALTTFYAFCEETGCTDGVQPYSGLVETPDGVFYGVTYGGGGVIVCPDLGCGTVFKITANGKLTTLHAFRKTDGWAPYGALILASDGNLYGTTNAGGKYNAGTVFKITTSGTLTTLYSFDCPGTSCPDGGYPYAGLVEGADGNFYGTTYEGQDPGFYGTVFKITPSGKLTTLHTFNNSDGSYPFEGLTLGSDGNLYGTTYSGGDLSACSGFGCGTFFKITASGTFTTLYEFSDGTDGKWPETGLVQATDGNFYGWSSVGGANDFGTLFSLSPSGVFTPVFPGSASTPLGSVIQGANGTFYGVTQYGGTGDDCGDREDENTCGTLFSLATGLGPFVTPLPTSGKIGSQVTILGYNLTGSTAVTFNGLSATFDVVSDTEIHTTVPSGATTGTIEVMTAAGVLESNIKFTVP